MLYSQAAAFWHAPQRNRHHRDRERKIQVERPPPRPVFDEPSAENRTKGSGNRRKAGPRANRPTAGCLIKRRADNREASRNEERRSDALNAARKDELENIRRDTASRGSRSEDSYADQKYQAAPQ